MSFDIRDRSYFVVSMLLQLFWCHAVVAAAAGTYLRRVLSRVHGVTFYTKLLPTMTVFAPVGYKSKSKLAKNSRNLLWFQARVVIATPLL